MNNVKSVSLKDPIKLNIKSIKTNNYQNKIEQFNNYEEINYSDLNNDGKLDKNDVDVLSKATDDNFVGPLPQSFDFNGDMFLFVDYISYEFVIVFYMWLLTWRLSITVKNIASDFTSFMINFKKIWLGKF